MHGGHAQKQNCFAFEDILPSYLRTVVSPSEGIIVVICNQEGIIEEVHQ